MARQPETDEVTFDQGIKDRFIVLRNVNQIQLSRSNKVEFGGEVRLERSDFTYEAAGYYNRSGVLIEEWQRSSAISGNKLSGFLTYRSSPSSRMSVSLGLRMDRVSHNNAYDLSPRFSTSLRLSDRIIFNAAAGSFYQSAPLYLISQQDENRDLKSLRADHYIAGFDFLLTPDTKLTVEAYAKEYRNAPVLSSESTMKDPIYLMDSYGEDFYDSISSEGKAYARGVELLVQKKLAKGIYGMISGSYFRTRYRDVAGVWRNREFDTRYLFSIVGGYKPNNRWEVSARWTIVGGRPHTPIDPIRSLALGAETYDLTRYNGQRLPAYHSLFLRIDRRMNYERTNLVFFLSVWNAYNRTNVDRLYWNYETDAVDTLTQFSLLPVGGMEFEF